MNRNRVELMGRLTRDPETRTAPSGLEIAELSLAINKRRKNAAGEIEEEATFIDVTLFDDKAKLAGKYLRKGEGVMIDGTLRVDKWEDKETGQKRNKMKVVGQQITFLGSSDKKPADGQSSRPAPFTPQASLPGPQPAPAQAPAKGDAMDEIPF
tara:strand:- start:2949 stop:3410 length:462 start_codon:yes stop_codon:yes gene_type:complete